MLRQPIANFLGTADNGVYCRMHSNL